jgi:hypothetical protein
MPRTRWRFDQRDDVVLPGGYLTALVGLVDKLQGLERRELLLLREQLLDVLRASAATAEDANRTYVLVIGAVAAVAAGNEFARARSLRPSLPTPGR